MNEEWVYDKVPGVSSPPQRIMYAGPDAARADRGFGGRGKAFIFFPSGYLEWAKGQGHETMVDISHGENELLNLLSHVFSPQEIKDLGAKSSSQGQPFVDWMVVRNELKKRAIFGRLGTVSGIDMLMLWPGTNNFLDLLSGLVDKLLSQNKISNDTVISIGRDAVYTVGQFLEKKKEVGSKLAKASSELGSLLKPPTWSASEINKSRERDSEGKKPFSYAFRYGESFGDFCKRQLRI